MQTIKYQDTVLHTEIFWQNIVLGHCITMIYWWLNVNLCNVLSPETIILHSNITIKCWFILRKFTQFYRKIFKFYRKFFKFYMDWFKGFISGCDSFHNDVFGLKDLNMSLLRIVFCKNSCFTNHASLRETSMIFI